MKVSLDIWILGFLKGVFWVLRFWVLGSRAMASSSSKRRLQWFNTLMTLKFSHFHRLKMFNAPQIEVLKNKEIHEIDGIKCSFIKLSRVKIF